MINKITELQSAKGMTGKTAVISKYKEDHDFRVFLFYLLNPFLSYNVSEETLRIKDPDKVTDLPHNAVFHDIFECCRRLNRHRGADAKTIRDVQAFLYSRDSEEETEIYIKLLAKTLRLGVTSKTVNKVIPNLIPEWEVQQAYPIDKYPIAEGTEFWLTQKMNGVRATMYDGELYARSGKKYTGLDHIINVLGELSELGQIVFDGELTLADNQGLSDNEAFRKATGILNSDSDDKSQICYTVFDAISEYDFFNEPTITYSKRRENLDWISETVKRSDCVRFLPVLYHGTDQRKIWELLDKMVQEDKEGLMLNTNVPYFRKRHKGILKVKQFYTMDLSIVGYEEGSGRLRGKLGAFVLDFKGNRVKVGTGFSDEQRISYWEHRDEMVGQLCEVKYKEVSYDKNTGLESLQFPVFVTIRTDKSEVSYG